MTTADKIRILTAKDVEGVIKVEREYLGPVVIPFRRIKGGEAVVSDDRYNNTLFINCTNPNHLELWMQYAAHNYNALYPSLNVPYDQVTICWAKYPGVN